MKTLSDLVFHVREHSAGRPELLSITRGRRRETVSTADFISSIHALALREQSLQSEDRPDETIEANVALNGPPHWLGELYLAAVYVRALSPAEVARNHRAGL